MLAGDILIDNKRCDELFDIEIGDVKLNGIKIHHLVPMKIKISVDT